MPADGMDARYDAVETVDRPSPYDTGRSTERADADDLDDAWPTDAELQSAVADARLEAFSANAKQLFDRGEPSEMSPREARALAAYEGAESEVQDLDSRGEGVSLAAQARLLGASLGELGRAQFDNGRPIVADSWVDPSETDIADGFEMSNYLQARGLFGTGQSGEVSYVDRETGRPGVVSGELQHASDAPDDGTGTFWVMPSDGSERRSVYSRDLVMIRPLDGDD